MSLEYTIMAVLVVFGIVLVTTSFVLNRNALKQHTKLLKSQADLIAKSQHKVQADMHRKASVAFENAVEENLVFIKEDTHRITSELTDYVKKHIEVAIQQELYQYEQMSKEIANTYATSLDEFQKIINHDHHRVSEKIAEHYNQLQMMIEKTIEEEKMRRIELFESNMTQVVRDYINQALVDRINVDEQLENIIDELNQNKEAMLEDMKRVG